MLVIPLKIFLVVGLYLEVWDVLWLGIFLVDVLVCYLMLTFFLLGIFLFLKLFLVLEPYLFSIQVRVREVGHHPLKRQPQPKLEV